MRAWEGEGEGESGFCEVCGGEGLRGVGASVLGVSALVLVRAGGEDRGEGVWGDVAAAHDGHVCVAGW